MHIPNKRCKRCVKDTLKDVVFQVKDVKDVKLLKRKTFFLNLIIHLLHLLLGIQRLLGCLLHVFYIFYEHRVQFAHTYCVDAPAGKREARILNLRCNETVRRKLLAVCRMIARNMTPCCVEAFESAVANVNLVSFPSESDRNEIQVNVCCCTYFCFHLHLLPGCVPFACRCH